MVTPGQGDPGHCEVVHFHCKLLYVYKIPSPGSIGHRAELWDVENPSQEVAMKIVVSGDTCCIKLFDYKSGEAFAECPIPAPGVAPLSTAVDPVIDSSRYFVLKLVDGKTGKHAFIGCGFARRNEASDFNAALAEHLQYLRRAQEAEQMRQKYQSQGTDDEEGRKVSTSAHSHLSLKPGETITLKLGKVGSGKIPSQWDSTELDPPLGSSDTTVPPKLLPPPPSGRLQASASVNEVAGEEQKVEDWGEFVS